MPGPNCVFLDVTQGSNQVPCVAGSPDCANGTLGFAAAPGYDLATGWGSVNAANLVDQWQTVSFAATTTQLSLTPPANLVHGQSVAFSVQVSAAAGTPTGQVALLAENGGGATLVQSFPLDASGAVNAATVLLPGGSYNLVAHYGGDGHDGGSVSAAVPLTVAPEPATVQLSPYQLNASGQQVPVSTLTYSDAYQIAIQVAGTSGHGLPSGTVSLHDTLAGPFSLPGAQGLDNAGKTDFANLNLPPGANALTATYSGDASFQPAASAPQTLTIQPAPSRVALSPSTQPGAVNVVLSLYGKAYINQIVYVDEGSTQVGSVSESGAGTFDATTNYRSVQASFTLPPLTGAQAALTASFPGDGYYLPSTSAPLTVNTPAKLVFNPARLTFPVTVMGTASAPLTSTLTNVGGTALNGLAFGMPYPPDFAQANTCGLSIAPGASCTVSVTYTPSQAGLEGGELSANTGAYLTLSGTSSGFTLELSFGPLAPVIGGQSASAQFLIVPDGGFQGAVSLSCADLPPLATCSFLPPALVLAGRDITVGVKAIVATTAAPVQGGTGGGRGRFWWDGLWAFALLLGTGAAARRRKRLLPELGLGLLLGAAVACGGGGGAAPPPPNGGGGGTGPPPSAYLSVPSLNLGGQAVGTPTLPQTVTLYNNSLASLAIGSISTTTSGGASQDFGQSNACGPSLAPRTHCDIAVTLTPSHLGAEAGTLVIADNAPNSPQSVALSGSGVNYTPSGSYNVKVVAAVGTAISTSSFLLQVK